MDEKDTAQAVLDSFWLRNGNRRRWDLREAPCVCDNHMRQDKVFQNSHSFLSVSLVYLIFSFPFKKAMAALVSQIFIRADRL